MRHCASVTCRDREPDRQREPRAGRFSNAARDAYGSVHQCHLATPDPLVHRHPLADCRTARTHIWRISTADPLAHRRTAHGGDGIRFAGACERIDDFNRQLPV